MRRLVILAVVAAAASLIVRKLTEGTAPTLGERCSKVCDRFLANMPRSFPPNRIMADLDALKEQTARVLEVLEEREQQDRPQE